LSTHHFNARNELWSVLIRCPLGLLPFIALYRVWRQFTYACCRGLKWALQEPLWWADAARGLPMILRQRSKISLRSYWKWMRLVRKPDTA
jgi:hypothetical protein